MKTHERRRSDKNQKVPSELNQNAEDSSEGDDKIPLAKLTNADMVNDTDLQEALLNIKETLESNEFNIDKNDYEFKGEVEEPPPDANIESPYSYFKNMDTDDMIEHLE